MTDETIEVRTSYLQNLENTKRLAETLWNDEKVGLPIKERYKELHPNANIPEVEVAKSAKKVHDEILSKVEATKKETVDRIEAFEKAQKEREDKDTQKRAETEFASEIESVKKKYQLTAEGMEKVFSRMKEKNNPDVESAAAWVTDNEPKTSPTHSSNYSPASLHPFGAGTEDKAWELLNKNPWDGRFADQEIRKIQEDFMNGRGHLYGSNGMGGEL